MQPSIKSLVWLRRDLRLHDHTSFSSALAQSGAIQLVFIFDTDILARFHNPDDKRLSFIAETLCFMGQEIADRGGELLVFYGKAQEIIPRLAVVLQVNTVFAGEDYEPEAIKRDQAIKGELYQEGIRFILENDHLLINPHEIIKKDGSPYGVFTPYSAVWKSIIHDFHTAERVVNDHGRYADPAHQAQMLKKERLRALDITKGPEHLLLLLGYNYVLLPEWCPEEAHAKLHGFMLHKIVHYAETRDHLAMEGTSKLSPYLRFGQLSVRECYRQAVAQPHAEAWIRQLIWRDFYAMVLFYCPISAKQEFLVKYRGQLNWRRDMELLGIFKAGMTGYPMIDGAMRQLAVEGWMHNRARMLVASFLTKDLMTCWTLGEEHFAQTLMDYELSSNVGNWQWAASTGTDLQSYFRIFNPVLQSKKIDPEGAYIRKYVPELRHVPTAYIHEPYRFKNTLGKLDYPDPIVDHDSVHQKVLAFFKNI